MAAALTRRGVPRLGLLDGLGVAGAALTLVALSSPGWYEVNDGFYSAWRFHAWLDLVVTAFSVVAVVVPLARIARAPKAPELVGRVATGLGVLAVGMLVYRVLAGEPDLFNPSGAELDIAARHAGVFVCLFFAVATLAAVTVAVRTRRRGAPVAPLRLTATRPAHWVTAVGGLGLLSSLPRDWYGTGYSDTSGFEALTVIDLVLLVLAAGALLVPGIVAARGDGIVGALLPLTVLCCALVAARVVWLPDTGFTNATYDERLPGLWIALAATVAIAAGLGRATADRRRRS